MNKKIIGYTTGVFDLFHIGHLNLLKHAKEHCDYLVVGVSTDELAYGLKGKYPVVPFEQRKEIVESIKYVDRVVPEISMDKKAAWEEIGYDILFKGQDAKEKLIYKKLEAELSKVGAKIHYLPYTQGISSRELRAIGTGKMKVDKDYCASSYLTYKYVGSTNILFKRGLLHRDHNLVSRKEKIPCSSGAKIGEYIEKTLSGIDLSHVGLIINKDISTAIIASFLPKGTKAYTYRFLPNQNKEELQIAESYAKAFDLNLKIVDISWDDYKIALDEMMGWDGAPAIPSEPQAYIMAKEIVSDGLNTVLCGDYANIEFGGVERLLSKDYTYEEWIKEYTFVSPALVLKNPVNVDELFKRYKIHDGIDNISFIREVYARSVVGALTNAFSKVGLTHIDVFERLCMEGELDLKRIRSGESKYMIRELFENRCKELPFYDKKPASRPADEWMKDWEGPIREEFIPGCTKNLSGASKLMVYNLERFLDHIEEA